MNKSINHRHKKAIVIGLSSDIGAALCSSWVKDGWEIFGTYRTASKSVEELRESTVQVVHCDLSETASIDLALSQFGNSINNWDVLVFSPGVQEPIGLFLECDFGEWEKSFIVNFTSQLRLLHALLPLRNSKSSENGVTVLFFAGGGVNDAPTRYSAYTLAKISLIKAVEIFAAEMPDVKFLIVGPGWVKTKIHDSLFRSKEKAGLHYEKAFKIFEDDSFTLMNDVIDCCNHLIGGPLSTLSGRNYSVVFDEWDDPNFYKILDENPNFFKLRRFGNKA